LVINTLQYDAQYIQRYTNFMFANKEGSCIEDIHSSITEIKFIFLLTVNFVAVHDIDDLFRVSKLLINK
jgi:hypothetical protein